MIEELEPLKKDEKFRFLCHEGIECFNECCQKLNLLLTPYDVVRIKNKLKMSSSEFLKEYTTWHVGYSTGLPVVMLKMDENSRCPFVSDRGCEIYSDRPGSCRLYPLVRVKAENEEHYYIIREEHCKGFKESKEWTLNEWIEDQGVREYNEMNDIFLELILVKRRSGKNLDDEEIKLIYTACFDVDAFRGHALKDGIVNADELDDTELIKFGIRWVIEKIF
jgi:hypothetical protein